MTRLRRTQVWLESDQFHQLQTLAQQQSQAQGRRVSVSQVVRELLRQALEQVNLSPKGHVSALRELFALGEAVRARHPYLLPEDWLEKDRQEHDHARFAEFFTGH